MERTGKSSLALIGLGAANLAHGALHIMQFVQSLILAGSSAIESHGLAEWMHSPWMSIAWAATGIITLCIGIKDFRHHRKCHSNVKFSLEIKPDCESAI